jgi:pantetheine-phosphate adenylyltransferase
MRKAIYPGTFDPITYGHIDILLKAANIFDEIILAVAEHTGKETIFSIEERTELCLQATQHIPKVKVTSFQGLVVDYANEIGAIVMIRGLRAISDFEYELSQALMNKTLSNSIDTIFFVPDHKYLYLSSTMIRQIVSLGGEVQDFLPPVVEQALKQKYFKKE